ncbi:hypothetical protein [Algoriphagus machipongonensis]|uniref:Lipoprotein n=1 Tax=Algoriphagus machipongonensis TaxID=388413 RepID=A3HVA3_9BACT|nr:hypothetical protein [Algoriphagus machipongonensis]EAZ82075.1 hypothetical protein ALPR1_02500 [Algoriphagus machipongonensis]
MKGHYTLFFVALLLVACNGVKKDSPIEEAFSPESERDLNINCFQYVNDQDTIKLSTEIDGTSVTGTLDYLFYEKDKTFGTIQGEVRDNLLIAEYNYLAEGDSSTRQVVFKKTTEGWEEGFGEMKVVDGVPVQVNLDSLDYSNSYELSPVPCDL